MPTGLKLIICPIAIAEQGTDYKITFILLSVCLSMLLQSQFSLDCAMRIGIVCQCCLSFVELFRLLVSSKDVDAVKEVLLKSTSLHIRKTLKRIIRHLDFLALRSSDNKVRFFILENSFYPCDAMLARVFAIATCLSVCPSVRPPHAGIVPSRAKAGS